MLDLAVQLRGAALALQRAVAPAVTDDYAADVLRGIVATLDLLADGCDDVVPFQRWDIAATSSLLAAVGVAVPAAEADDPAALDEQHRAVRARLEASIDRVRADPGASAAAATLFRERASRHPFAARPRRDP